MTTSQVIDNINNLDDWAGRFHINPYDCFKAFVETYIVTHPFEQNNVDYRELGVYHYLHSKGSIANR